ncbi:MAG: histidinol-phosphatase HisJ family protein [Oscillospiraceae bacterium]|jgi:histidinol-phosphatase (PHP family)|nr:histidinol-phosphatase HisJ family protein [Oscillospiraceae bacterium]
MNDMHVHTHFSPDSDESFAAYIAAARQKGVSAVCFTDHVDTNPNDSGTGYYDSAAFFAELSRARADAPDLNLLAGIEFSEPHLWTKKLAEYQKLPYDCIIGSVHFSNCEPDLFFSDLVAIGVSAENCYASYWREVLKTVTAGGFDVLGHIDIPKRYYKTLVYVEAMLREILRKMLDGGIIPEINTSSLRKGLPDTMPGRDILRLYAEEGGKYCTIGSDAHTADDLAADNAAAQSLLAELGLREVTFVKREMVPVS